VNRNFTHTTKWFESPNATNGLGKEGINWLESIIPKCNFAADLQATTAQDWILWVENFLMITFVGRWR